MVRRGTLGDSFFLKIEVIKDFLGAISLYTIPSKYSLSKNFFLMKLTSSAERGLKESETKLSTVDFENLQFVQLYTFSIPPPSPFKIGEHRKFFRL